MTNKEKAKLKDSILQHLSEKVDIESEELSEILNMGVQKVRSVLLELESDSKINIRIAETKDLSHRYIKKHPDTNVEKDFYLNKYKFGRKKSIVKQIAVWVPIASVLVFGLFNLLPKETEKTMLNPKENDSIIDEVIPTKDESVIILTDSIITTHKDSI